MMLLPLRSLRARMDSQCERTGEALIQALRDDIQLHPPEVRALCRNQIGARRSHELVRNVSEDGLGEV